MGLLRLKDWFSLEENLTHGVLFVAAQTIGIIPLIKVGIARHNAVGRRPVVGEEIHFCVSVLGVRHQITVFLHFTPKRILHGNHVDARDRTGIVFITVKSDFFKTAFQILGAGLGESIVDNVADTNRQQR